MFLYQNLKIKKTIQFIFCNGEKTLAAKELNKKYSKKLPSQKKLQNSKFYTL